MDRRSFFQRTAGIFVSVVVTPMVMRPESVGLQRLVDDYDGTESPVHPFWKNQNMSASPEYTEAQWDAMRVEMRRIYNDCTRGV